MCHKKLQPKSLKTSQKSGEMGADEFREVCCSDPDFIDSLDFDSLRRMEVVAAVFRFGVEVPRSATGSYFARDIFQGLIKSFIVKYPAAVDQNSHEKLPATKPL